MASGTKKKDDDEARYTDPRHPDWDPRNFPPDVQERIDKQLDFITPGIDSLLKMLLNGAGALRGILIASAQRHELAEMQGKPPPEPGTEEAAMIVGVAQGTHFALDIWFKKLISELRAEALRQDASGATPPPPPPRAPGTTLH